MPSKWLPTSFCPTNCTCSSDGELNPSNGAPIQSFEPALGVSDPYLVEIREVTSDPTNNPNLYLFDWIKCDGRLMAIMDNTSAFSLLGTRYGGDGRIHFGIPDLRGQGNYYIAMRGVTPGFVGP